MQFILFFFTYQESPEINDGLFVSVVTGRHSLAVEATCKLVFVADMASQTGCGGEGAFAFVTGKVL